MKKLLINFSILLLSIQTHALSLKTVSQDNSTVKYNLQDQKLPGLCREVISLVENEIPDLKFTGLGRAVPIQRIEQFLQKNEIDVFFCLLKTSEREDKFHYINVPIYSVKHVLLAKASDPIFQKKILKLSDLKHEGIVLVNKGSSLIQNLKNAGIKYSDGGKSDLQIIELLEANRGRFFYGQDATLRFMLKNHAKKDNYRLITIPEDANAQYVVYSKKLDPKIAGQLTSALKKLSDSGALVKVYQKYSQHREVQQKWTLMVN